MLVVKVWDKEGTSYFGNVFKVSEVAGKVQFSQMTPSGISVYSPTGTITTYTEAGFQLDQWAVKKEGE